VLTEAAQAGNVRVDVTPDELTTYRLYALAAACRPPTRSLGSSRSHWLAALGR
jgi:hypothetical protein